MDPKVPGLLEEMHWNQTIAPSMMALLDEKCSVIAHNLDVDQ
jgi:hypothetical protein